MRGSQSALPDLSRPFSRVSEPAVRQGDAKKPVPFSLRLSAEERAWLEEQAEGRPLGAYIRERLLGEKVAKRRQTRRPPVNERQVAAVLAMLGQSNIPNNLNQLARHANSGTLDISRNVEAELEDACKAVLVMRDALLVALGMQPALMGGSGGGGGT